MLKTLRAATFEVLETMFFLFPEDPEEIAVLFAGQALQARVPVRGPQPFGVRLTVPQELAREMGANFLGIAPQELRREHLEDVVREAANMIVGAFLMRSRASGAFHLQPPTVTWLNLDERPQEATPQRLFLAVSDYGLEAAVELAPRPAAQTRPRQAAPAR